MDSVLLNRPALKAEIDKVAEVAGYLWQKGWAERNGGNITVNVTELVDDALRAMPAISPARPIGQTLPRLADCWFYCKGTGRRMRDLARDPMANGSLIRILPAGDSYEIVADAPVTPTSELPSHLAVHDWLIATGSPYRASLHTHPIELVALTHGRPWLEKDAATRMLWSMIPETKAFCPRGLGIVPYMLPSSVELAEATLRTLADGYDVVMWEKHGVFAVDVDIIDAFDLSGRQGNGLRARRNERRPAAGAERRFPSAEIGPFTAGCRTAGRWSGCDWFPASRPGKRDLPGYTGCIPCPRA